MDGSVFDRIVRNLAEHAHRRETLRALAGGSLIVAAGSLHAEQVTGKKKKKKKRERKIGQTCGGKKKCSKRPGAVSCELFENQECNGVELAGKRCCGQIGSKCDPNFGEPGGPNPETFGNCSCCDPFFCGRQLNGEFRCQDEDT